MAHLRQEQSRRADSHDGADHVRGLVRRACEAIGLAYRETNYLVFRRGPYVIAAGLDESISAEPTACGGTSSTSSTRGCRSGNP